MDGRCYEDHSLEGLSNTKTTFSIAELRCDVYAGPWLLWCWNTNCLVSVCLESNVATFKTFNLNYVTVTCKAPGYPNFTTCSGHLDCGSCEISDSCGGGYEDDWLLGCCAVLSGRSLPTFQRSLLPALLMEAASTSETSVNFYQTTRRNNPEDGHLHGCSCFCHLVSSNTLL
jgi:hypothetical protein